MANVEGSLWSVEYRGYCPEGWPPRLAEMFIPGGSSTCPAYIENFPREPGSGYFITHAWVSRPPKPIPQTTLARVRKKRAERRLQQKVPMFADHFLAEELARKPEYYAGITDPDIETAKQQALAMEEQRFALLNSRPNILVIFAVVPAAAREKAEQIRNEIAEAQARQTAQ